MTEKQKIIDKKLVYKQKIMYLCNVLENMFNHLKQKQWTTS